MIRRIVEIDEEKCTGCGLCAKACHEGAIAMVNGKAKLLRDDYCDGLGDCLPVCPADAIRIIEREAADYDEAAVKARQNKKVVTTDCGCPGACAMKLRPKNSARLDDETVPSQLRQWPVQIQLVSPVAAYFENADILVAADCAAYAYGNFHDKFIKGRVTLIGCPKLDTMDYTEKLAEIFQQNDIRSVVVTRMQVPCCGGLERAVKEAVKRSGKNIPIQVFTLSADGSIL